MAGSTSDQFLRTLHKTKNLKRSLQALYNTDKSEEELQSIIKESSKILPSLANVGNFAGFKKTKLELHKRRLTDKHINELKSDPEVAANVQAHSRRKLGVIDDVVSGAADAIGSMLGVNSQPSDGDDAQLEYVRPPIGYASSTGSSTQPPGIDKQKQHADRRKARREDMGAGQLKKTRPVSGMTAAQVAGEVTGINAAARLAKKAGDAVQNAINPPEQLRPIRGKDEIEPAEAEQQGASSPVRAFSRIAEYDLDPSINKEFKEQYESLFNFMEAADVVHPDADFGMRGFYNKYYKGRGLKPLYVDDSIDDVIDAFNALIADEFERQKGPVYREPITEASMFSQAASAVSDALGITAASRAVGGMLDSVTPEIVKEVASQMQPTPAIQVRSDANIPIPHDPLTVTEAAGKLVHAAASAYESGAAAIADLATLPTRVVGMAVMDSWMGGGQADLLARAALLDPRDEFKFGSMPPRMGSAPALAVPNGLSNQPAFEDAPLTTRLSPMVEQILAPPDSRPSPSSQPVNGRLAQQAFLNWQQDDQAPYAVR